MSLKPYEQNIRSQNGEDGVVAEIFNRIGTESHYCVELGAWDGERLSNVWNLWCNQGWKALLIEGDAGRYEKLKERIQPFPGVTAWNAYVTPQGERSLAAIFEQAGLPRRLDLLSIDIDGDDYWLLKFLSGYTPRVVIIEFNPTIPAEVEMVQHEGRYFGASAKSLVALGHEKGYQLAHVTATNVILVHNQDFPKLRMPEPKVEDFREVFAPIYVITGFDGSAWITQAPPFGIRGSGRTAKGKVTLRSLLKSLGNFLFAKRPQQIFHYAESNRPQGFRPIRLLH